MAVTESKYIEPATRRSIRLRPSTVSSAVPAQAPTPTPPVDRETRRRSERRVGSRSVTLTKHHANGVTKPRSKSTGKSSQRIRLATPDAGHDSSRKSPKRVKWDTPVATESPPRELIFDTTLHQFQDTKPTVNYTFGIELEVMVICAVDDLLPRLPANMQKRSRKTLRQQLQTATELGGLDHFVREMLQETLTQAGLKVNSARSDEENIHQWSIEPEPSILTKAERTAHPNDVVVGVEIKTGALDYTAASLAEVVKGIEALNSKFTITYNDSCGMHVHIGQVDQLSGRQQQLSVPTCQHLLILHLLFDDQINRLHPENVLSGFEWPQTPRARMADLHGQDAVQAAQAVLKAKTHKALVDLLSIGTAEDRNPDDRNVTINMTNLCHVDNFNTIEFRQHEGCFEPEMVLRRVQLCVVMAHWAVNARREVVEKLVWAFEHNLQLDTAQLLENIGTDRQTVEYYSERLYDHDKPTIGQRKRTLRSVGGQRLGERTDAEINAMLQDPLRPLFAATTSKHPAAKQLPRSMAKVRKASQTFKVLGSGLFLSQDTGHYDIRFKVVDTTETTVEPFWATEESATLLGQTTVVKGGILQRTRARRWVKGKHEAIRKRWPWSTDSRRVPNSCK